MGGRYKWFHFSQVEIIDCINH